MLQALLLLRRILLLFSPGGPSLSRSSTCPLWELARHPQLLLLHQQEGDARNRATDAARVAPVTLAADGAPPACTTRGEMGPPGAPGRSYKNRKAAESPIRWCRAVRLPMATTSPGASLQVLLLSAAA